jgi:hypothetical protein
MASYIGGFARLITRAGLLAVSGPLGGALLVGTPVDTCVAS